MWVNRQCKPNHRGTEAQRKHILALLILLFLESSVSLCFCGNIQHRKVGRSNKRIFATVRMIWMR
jgi:hypothetical protein